MDLRASPEAQRIKSFRAIRLLPTMCDPLLWSTPSCSPRFLEMVMDGRSRLWGGNWGVNSLPWEGKGSPRPWKGSSTSGTPRAGSDSGGGVIGGISNSSSPRLGVWNVCKIKGNTTQEIFHTPFFYLYFPLERRGKVFAWKQLHSEAKYLFLQWKHLKHRFPHRKFCWSFWLKI